jgi:hypothetical protein
MNKRINYLLHILFGILFILISLESASYSIDILFYLALTFVFSWVLFLIIFLGFNFKNISKALLKFSILLILTICIIYPTIAIQNRFTRENANNLIMKIDEYYKHNYQYPESLNTISSKKELSYWVGVFPKKFKYLKTSDGFTLTYRDSGMSSYLSDKKEWVPID